MQYNANKNIIHNTYCIQYWHYFLLQLQWLEILIGFIKYFFLKSTRMMCTVRNSSRWLFKMLWIQKLIQHVVFLSTLSFNCEFSSPSVVFVALRMCLKDILHICLDLVCCCNQETKQEPAQKVEVKDRVHLQSDVGGGQAWAASWLALSNVLNNRFFPAWMGACICWDIRFCLWSANWCEMILRGFDL